MNFFLLVTAARSVTCSRRSLTEDPVSSATYLVKIFKSLYRRARTAIFLSLSHSHKHSTHYQGQLLYTIEH